MPETYELEPQPPHKPRRFAWGSFFTVLLLMPVLVQWVAFLMGLALGVVFDASGLKLLNNGYYLEPWMLLVGAVMAFVLGWRYKSQKTQPANWQFHYGALIAPIVYTVAVYAIVFALGKISSGAVLWLGVGLIAFALTSISLSFSASASSGWVILWIPVATYTFFILGFAAKSWRRGFFKPVSSKILVITVLICAGLLAFAVWQYYDRSQRMLSPVERAYTRVSEQIGEQQNYAWRRNTNPALSDMPAVVLRGVSTLSISSDFPRLDGATAVFPIYASAVHSIYQKPQNVEEQKQLDQLVQSSRTPNAYQRLIDSEVDLIFVAAPSQKQIEAAQAQGLTLQMTPIAKEAFVFLVNQQNPVKTLAVQQIRDIYSGRINNWREVGGQGARILAFQRAEGSGSQSTMVNHVMEGVPLRAPLKEAVFEGMGGMIEGVAEYRNAENALGYSFRYYSTRMNTSDEIRLLAIDGIEPTVENIRNGNYPFTVDVYMVTARPVSENTQKLMDWFLSEQGQQLVHDVGYVPVSHE
ncbi:Phosphate-binding protein PstS 1 [Saezia sanguinis]|uniref:Phosphate-binding protein PstS 1 n=1 Tax=Saezia sanguinis TaxID=1965230 RepID=A0A433SA14_9BURK|nr:substrate-binding domain-containing protein [Saezia sanguinis]RUS65587.1 Phosphate-binding protein PstS 1 [Saezia sanguinis]